MSLEQALQENTATMKELIAALLANKPMAVHVNTSVEAHEEKVAAIVEKAVADKKEKATSKKSTAETVSQENTATQPASEKAEDVGNQGGVVLTYDLVKAPFMRILKEKGEAECRKLLSELGFQTLKDIADKGPEFFEEPYKKIKAREKELFGEEGDLA